MTRSRAATGYLLRLLFRVLILPSALLASLTLTALVDPRETETIELIDSLVEQYASWLKISGEYREEYYVTFMLDGDRVLVVVEEEMLSDRQYISGETRTSFDPRDIVDIQLADNRLRFNCRDNKRCVREFTMSHQYPSQRGTERLDYATITFTPGTDEHQVRAKNAFVRLFRLRGVALNNAAGPIHE